MATTKKTKTKRNRSEASPSPELDVSGRDFDSLASLKAHWKKHRKHGHLVLQPGTKFRVFIEPPLTARVSASVINGSPATAPIAHAVKGEWVEWTALKKPRAKSKKVDRVTYCLATLVGERQKADVWFGVIVPFES